jgi:hypothetical protein
MADAGSGRNPAAPEAKTQLQETRGGVWRWPASGLEKDERKMLRRLNGLGALLLAVLGKDQSLREIPGF